MVTPTTDSLWRLYETLKPHERLVIEMKALIGDALVSKPDFLACLRLTGSGPGDRPWSVSSLKTILDDFEKRRLLDHSLVCAPALAHRLARHVAENPANDFTMEALKRALPHSPRDKKDRRPVYLMMPLASDIDLFRRLRLAIYSNDENEFARLKKIIGPDQHSENRKILSRFLWNLPADAEWLKTRKPSICMALAAARLWGFLAFGPPSEDLIAAFEILSRDSAPSVEGNRLMIRRAILSGAFDEALERAAELPMEEGYFLAATEATIAFLNGENERALEGFRGALKQAKKYYSKRRLTLEAEFGLFHILALLKTQDVTLHTEIRGLLDVGLMGDDTHALGYVALEGLLHVAAGQEGLARGSADKIGKLKTHQALARALIALAEFAFDSDEVRRRESRNKTDYEAIAPLLPLVALIHAQVLSRTGPNKEQWRGVCLADHARTIIDFPDIIIVKPMWERAFETLKTMLTNDGRAAIADPPRSSGKRLAFFVDPDLQTIEALEQVFKKNEWSAGRAIAMKRLYEQDPKLDYLTEQDRRVLRCLRRFESWYDDPPYEFDTYKALLKLVEHPHVFDARERTRHVELIAYPAELVVAETKTGFLFDLSHHAERPSIFIEAETPTRWRVIEVDAKLLVLQESLGSRGLVVPRAAKDQVIALLRTKTPLLPIRSELADVEVETLAGDPSPVVRIARLGSGFQGGGSKGEGLKLSLVVRPTGPEGPFYSAGQGGHSVLVTVNGRSERVSRDLAAETAAVDAFLKACPSLESWRVGDNDWEIDTLSPALEFLVEACAFTGSVKFEWREGEAFKITRPVMSDNISYKLSRRQNWFEISGKIKIDDDLLLDMEDVLARLDKAQGRFVPLDEGRFLVLTEDLQRQLGHLRAVSEDGSNGRRLSLYGTLAVEELIESAGEIEADRHWWAHVEKIKAARAHVPFVPTTLQAELRDYQIEGFEWLSRLAHLGVGACLADDMGLGKTVQAIAVLIERQAKGPSLIVAPTSVCHNWEQEIARFAPVLSVHPFAAAEGRGALVESLGPGDVLLVSYGLLHQEEEALSVRSWNIVIFDEAQNLKNAATKRAKASRALDADFRIALSGTPIENYLDELWSLFNTINPGLLGSREGFQKRFTAKIERDRDAAAREALRALIRPFILRRTKSAVLRELPPRTEVTIEISLSDEERAFYEALRRQALATLSVLEGPSGQRQIHILAEITRLRRACCHPALIDAASGLESAKLATFLELVEELIRNRHKALVFSQFIGHLDLVKAALDARKITYQYLDGSVPAPLRAERVQAFQNGIGDLFLISLKAGGAGLNLTAADYVIHLDPWWNPAVEDQASDRAYRIGQSRPVTVYRLVVKDSIEEKILDLHARKRELAADLLDGAEMAVRLGEDELLALIGS